MLQNGKKERSDRCIVVLIASMEDTVISTLSHSYEKVTKYYEKEVIFTGRVL